ncbi:MAG: DUF1329 domain-containing protein [Desulfobacterales bacterium]
MSFKRAFYPLVAVLAVFGFVLTGTAFSAEPKPGDVIDASNIDQYKDYFPTIMQGYIEDGWGIVDPVAIHVREKTNVEMPQKYLDASQKNIGKVTLNADNTPENLVAGLPFPEVKEPNRAWKIMWNHYYRWRSDGFSYNDGYWYTSQRKGGPISSALSQIDMLFYTHRTAVDPKPVLPNREDLFSALLLNSRTPPNKDMVTLTWRYEDPFKNDDMWTYVPTLRRTLRMVSSERANPVRGTPFTWDDFYGFDGKLSEWTPKLVGETKLLALMNQQTKCVPGTKYEHGYPHPVVSGPSDPYELRDFWIVDVVPNNSRHPEEKKTLYIEKETYHVMYAHVYDKQGNLWKGCINCIVNYDTAKGEPAWTQCSSSLSDLKNNFWSQNLLWTVTADAPMIKERFSPGALGSNF